MGPLRRLGLFGGTFDPPHLGHLALAEWASQRLGLDRVVFVPAGRPPHKRRRALTDAAARLAMTRLAVRGNPSFTVSSLELEREAPSFTADTLRAFAQQWPGSRLYLLIGADSLDDFRHWHEPAAILRLATIAVAGRPGAGRVATRRWARRHRVVWLGNPEFGVSSSLVRARVRAGLSVRYLVPEAVADYLARHRLYRNRR